MFDILIFKGVVVLFVLMLKNILLKGGNFIFILRDVKGEIFERNILME